jgi:hypothetical protein
MGILPMRPDWVPKSSGGASSLASRARPDWVGKGARFRSCRPLHRTHGQDAHATSNPFQKHGAGKQGIGRESKCCRLSSILLRTGISEFGRGCGMGFQPMQVRNDAEVP